jgi:hypothetical protein
LDIKALLEKNKARYNIREIMLLSPEGTGKEFSGAANVKDVLEKGQWDMVHYAGHSYYDASGKTGVVFFPNGE